MKSTIKAKENLVLVCDYYVADNWYGQRYRLIVKPTESTYFSSSKEALSFKNELKAFSKQEKVSIYVANEKELVQYIYCGVGPSIYYNTSSYSIQDIESELSSEFKAKRCLKQNNIKFRFDKKNYTFEVSHSSLDKAKELIRDFPGYYTRQSFLLA